MVLDGFAKYVVGGVDPNRQKGERKMSNKFRLYAYAHTREVKNINLFSIADWRNEVSEKTTPDTGAVTTLAASFKAMNVDDKRGPFSFIWKPDRYVPASHFSSLKPGEDFTLELRIQLIDDSKSVKFHTNWNFYQCHYQKSRRKGGMHKVEASYGLFRPSE